MHWKPLTRPALIAGSACISLAFAACSGGGGASSPTPPLASGTTAPALPTSSTTAKVTIVWPAVAGPSAAARRRPAYLSNATKSVTIVENGVTTEVDNPNVGTTGPTQTSTTVLIPVAPGSVDFVVSSFDALKAAGTLLGRTPTLSETIVAGQLNALTFTLNGNLGKIACTAVAPFVTAVAADKTGTSFTMVGTAGDLQLTAEDPDGYTIVAPGAIPTVTLAANDTTMASTAPVAGSTNEYVVNVVPSGTAEKFVASGTDLNGNTVSTTCSITRDVALYVTNVGQYSTTSVTIYDATAANATGGTVNAVPVATLGRPVPSASAAAVADATDLIAPQFPAVDPKGDLFVSNQGPLPSATYGPTTGYVAIYGPGTGQVGNAAPIGMITGLNRPEGVAFDQKGNLYVMSADRITVYPPTANGVTAPAVPSQTIAGSNTGLFTCYGMHVDNAANVYVGCSDAIYIFATGVFGNATPTTILGPGSVAVPGMTVAYGSVSTLDAAADSSGDLFAPGSNNNVNTVLEYLGGQTTAPVVSPGPPFSQPIGIFVDTADVAPEDAIYVANYGNSSIDYYASSATLMTGVLPDTTYSGTLTGLNHPFGVTAR